MNYQIFVIGKKPNASNNEIGIAVSSPTVSRQHARLTYDNGEFYLEDLNSTNKTYVNNEEISSKVKVNQNDSISLGKKVPFSLNHPAILNYLKKGANPDYANWGARLGGYILDVLFFALLTSPIYALFYGGLYLAEDLNEISLSVISVVFLLTGVLLGFHFYYAVTINKTGYTWGKKLANVKVIDAESTNYPSKGQVWGRYLAYNLSAFILMIGFFMPLWTKKRQALHDMLANTIVVKSAKGK